MYNAIISHLPPFGMDEAKFIMKICAPVLNPYQYIGSGTRCWTFHWVSS